jgi:methylmalonyl-CoA mutase
MEQLFTDFSSTDANTWKSRLEKDLKGITFEQLTSTDRNGINIHPFYTAEDIAPAPPIRSMGDWDIVSTYVVEDASVSNKKALDALNGGASGLHFIISKHIAVKALLQNIELPYIYCHFTVGHNASAFVDELRAYCSEQNWDLSSMRCFITHDSIALMLAGKEMGQPMLLDTNSLSVDTSQYLNAGATTVYELACTIAQVQEYLHLYNEATRLEAIKCIHIVTATDTAYFEQIAKMRALRKLMSLLCEAYQINPFIHIHVNTANTYRSPFDSYSNLLRDSVAGMAAVIGGCDSLYIPPFDAAKSAPNESSDRLSRNQQLIFKEESYFNKVADVAAGSYYIESLTEQLAEQAWEAFQQLEAEGGLIASYRNGTVKARIEEQAAQLVSEYQSGRRVLIGVNKFVNPDDEPQKHQSNVANERGLQALALGSILAQK